jgi:hypothetical protein
LVILRKILTADWGNVDAVAFKHFSLNYVFEIESDEFNRWGIDA